MIEITPAWRPKPITSKTLLRAGFSQDQLDTIGKIFVERYDRQIIANAGSVYSKMVRDSGNGHGITHKPDGALEAVLAKQTNKSKDGKQRAQEAKRQDKVMTQAEVEAYYNERKLIL